MAHAERGVGDSVQGTAKQSGTYTRQEESCHRKRAQNNNKKDVQGREKKDGQKGQCTWNREGGAERR
jgi:hypothetical protein